jgi:arylsulfatase A-like enzyme
VWTRACLVAVLLAALGCGRSGPPPPNVVLVLVDTLRADRLGSYGYQRGVTPFLDELAARGTRFARAYAPSSWTNPSVASLFTSRAPEQHLVTRQDAVLDDAEETLAEALEPLGYEAIGVVANFRLQRQLGFGQGFDVWQPATVEQFGNGDKARAPVVGQETLARLERHWRRWPWQRDQPVLLYLHFMEPHGPYRPPEPFRARFADVVPPSVSADAANQKLVDGDFAAVSPDEVALLDALYDAEIAAFDAALRALFGELAARGVLGGALVVVTADHGEEFFEHGGLGHGRTLYEESVRVPLLMLGPGVPAGRVVDAVVSLLDVAPTLLDLLGLPPAPTFEGRSLVPLFAGAAAEPRPALFELPHPGSRFDLRVHTHGEVDGTKKLVVRREPNVFVGVHEAYDLAGDPGEKTPLPAPEGAAMAKDLEAWRAELATRARGAVSHAPLDDETRDRLKALGYAE